MPAIHRIEDWTPYQHIARLRDRLLAAWVDWLKVGRNTPGTKSDDEAFAMYSDYRKSLDAVARLSRIWGLDPAPCYEFSHVDCQPDHRYFGALNGRLADFLVVCAAEVEVQWRFVGGLKEHGVHPEAVGIERIIRERGDKLFIASHYWRPFLLITHVRNLLAEWEPLTRRLGQQTSDENVQYQFAWHEVAQAVRELAVEANKFGINTDPIYDFRQFHKPDSTRNHAFAAMTKLVDFLIRFEDKANAEYQTQAAKGVPPDALYPVFWGRAKDDSPSPSNPQPRPPSDESAPAPSSQTAPPADGPQPPNVLAWGGKTICGVEPIPWNLLNFIWERKTAKEVDVIEAVWGHDSAASESDGPLKSAVKKANRAIEQVGFPKSISRKNGYIVMS